MNLRADWVTEDAIESIERGLAEKGYTLGASGNFNLNFRERIDHVGNQYVLAGMDAIMTNANHDRVAEGYAKRKIFRSQTKLVMISFRDLLARLDYCQ